jgi:hypothetical protein
MPSSSGWTRDQLLVALSLYCQIPFGKISHRNPDIVRWAELIGRTPSALSMKMGNIASLDPTIRSTGRSGLENASVADKAIWEEMQSDWERFAVEVERAAMGFGAQPTAPAERIESGEDYSGAERAVEARARIGQNFFRNAVLSAYDYRCCITGLAVPSLLVASHIIPWRIDASNRLNPRNGLSLSALHDRAFDAGIMTVGNDLTVRISRRDSLKSDPFFKIALMAYDGKPISRPEKFAPDASFLAYHHEHIFQR